MNRYDLSDSGNEIVPDPDGDFVRYEDARKAEARVADLERLRELRMESAPGVLPCPHCGESRIAAKPEREPGLRVYVHRRFPGEPDDGPEALDYVVGCGSCAAQGGRAHSASGAINWWNMRATPTEAVG